MRKYLYASICLFLLISGMVIARQVPMLFYGEASWYGGKFQGRRTANGEVFDTNKMTAAHKTLPFGSVVQVINLLNEKKVIVRINDRGPFVKNRVLDLSRAAAKLLAFEKKGVAKVEVRVLKLGAGKYIKDTTKKIVKKKVQVSKRKPFQDIKPKVKHTQPIKRVVPVFLSKGQYVIQVGAFGSKKNAAALAVKLRNEGVKAFVKNPESGRFYRVWVGPFAKRDSAKILFDQLKNKNYKGFIRKV